jgi:hypothetical protein
VCRFDCPTFRLEGKTIGVEMFSAFTMATLQMLRCLQVQKTSWRDCFFQWETKKKGVIPPARKAYLMPGTSGLVGSFHANMVAPKVWLSDDGVRRVAMAAQNSMTSTCETCFLCSRFWFFQKKCAVQLFVFDVYKEHNETSLTPIFSQQSFPFSNNDDQNCVLSDSRVFCEDFPFTGSIQVAMECAGEVLLVVQLVDFFKKKKKTLEKVDQLFLTSTFG